MDKYQMSDVITKIDEYYPGKMKSNVHSVTMVWYEFFKDCDYECILSCLNKYARENSYPPTIADLLELYRNGLEKTERQVDIQANRIKSALEWVENKEPVEDCLNHYYSFINRTPIVNRYIVARSIGDYLWDYVTHNEGSIFNFINWMEEFVNGKEL